MLKTEQLILNVGLRDEATFDNFYLAHNEQLVAMLREFSGGDGNKSLYLWGTKSSGRSHLLQACCHHATRLGLSAIYLPLRDYQQLSPEILQNLEHIALVCLDDLEFVLGKRAWEEAIFHAINRLNETDTHLLVAAKDAPSKLNFILPDLASRLAAGAGFQLYTLSDEQKLIVLQLRARQRGFSLPNNVALFLLKRVERDLESLFDVLERLDKASLVAQHKLTIPFIKTVLSLV